MAYCNRLVTGTSKQDSRSIYKVKNVIRIMTTFSKKKKKKKKKKKRFFFECYKRHICKISILRDILSHGCLVKRFLIGGHPSRKLSKKTKCFYSPVSYKSTINQFCCHEWCKNRILFNY